MNKQNTGPNRGIEWTNYTWNPVAGCMHGCRWVMPDGSIARCYAEAVAEGVARKAYPEGFAHHYWYPERLSEPSQVKTPSKIFLDSMSDLMGHWVTDEQIEQVLEVCENNPHHTFQLLTKQPPRLLKFEFPPNVWVGVSAPPSILMGKRLTDEQHHRYVSTALQTLNNVKASVRWMSIEPLTFDIAHEFELWNRAMKPWYLPLEWVVIGAATHGRKVYSVNDGWLSKLLEMLTSTKSLTSNGAAISIFFKGNLRGNPAASPWREEFPAAQQKSPAAVETTGL